MSYTATVYHIMIASPGDITEEPDIIRDIIYEWNAIHAKDKNIVLLPVSWRTHSSPSMGRPQGVINQQVLKDADLLVGIFGNRLGSPTGRFQSGTIEEIKTHVKQNKQAMLYFSDVPVSRRDVDRKQEDALEKFRNYCMRNALYQPYQTIDDFKQKFRRHLDQKVIEYFTSPIEREDTLTEVNPVLPTVSEDARRLAFETSSDPDGELIMTIPKGGLTIYVNGKEFPEVRTPKEEARWRGAMKELLNSDLLSDKGNQGQIFALTPNGYLVAESYTSLD